MFRPDPALPAPRCGQKTPTPAGLSPSASAKPDVASRGRKLRYLLFVKRLRYESLKVTILLILPLHLACGVVHVQANAPRRLTLSESVQLALKQNPQAQIANLDLAQSKQDRVISRSALLPQAQLEVFDRAQRLNLEAFIGRKLPAFSQHAGPFQLFQAGPTFAMPVLDLTLWRRYQGAGQGTLGD